MKEQNKQESLYSLLKNNYVQHKNVKHHKKTSHDEFNIFKCLCL